MFQGSCRDASSTLGTTPSTRVLPILLPQFMNRYLKTNLYRVPRHVRYSRPCRFRIFFMAADSLSTVPFRVPIARAHVFLRSRHLFHVCPHQFHCSLCSYGEGYLTFARAGACFLKVPSLCPGLYTAYTAYTLYTACNAYTAYTAYTAIYAVYGV